MWRHRETFSRAARGHLETRAGALTPSPRRGEGWGEAGACGVDWGCFADLHSKSRRNKRLRLHALAPHPRPLASGEREDVARRSHSHRHSNAGAERARPLSLPARCAFAVTKAQRAAADSPEHSTNAANQICEREIFHPARAALLS